MFRELVVHWSLTRDCYGWCQKKKYETVRLFFQIPYKIAPRRTGDIASCYADPSLAEKEMGWKATRGLAEMCMYSL